MFRNAISIVVLLQLLFFYCMDIDYFLEYFDIKKLVYSIVIILLFVSYFIMYVKYGYFGIINWGCMNIVGFFIMINNNIKYIKSLLMSFSGSLGFSWFYEIFWIKEHNHDMFFSNHHVLYIHCGLVSLIIFIIFIIDSDIVLSESFFYCLCIFIMWVAIYDDIAPHISHQIMELVNFRLIKYTSRIGGDLLLLSIFRNLKGKLKQ